MGPKMEPKNRKKHDLIWLNVYTRLEAVFGRISGVSDARIESSGGQKGRQQRQGTKIGALHNNHGKPSKQLHFVPCRGHFRRPRAGKSVPGMRCFWKGGVKATWHRFLVDFGTILGSKSAPKVV